jgi:hypothetical protein
LRARQTSAIGHRVELPVVADGQRGLHQQAVPPGPDLHVAAEGHGVGVVRGGVDVVVHRQLPPDPHVLVHRVDQAPRDRLAAVLVGGVDSRPVGEGRHVAQGSRRALDAHALVAPGIPQRLGEAAVRAHRANARAGAVALHAAIPLDQREVCGAGELEEVEGALELPDGHLEVGREGERRVHVLERGAAPREVGLDPPAQEVVHREVDDEARATDEEVVGGTVDGRDRVLGVQAATDPERGPAARHLELCAQGEREEDGEEDGEAEEGAMHGGTPSHQ